jgi:uncharacterized protein (UPF0332 family)
MQSKRTDLCNYRLEKAKEDLKAAQILLKEGLFSQTLNRSYYSIFHAVRALFALDEFETHKHSGLISYFNKNYVMEGIFEKEYSKILTQAEWVRNKSDYRDFYIVSKDSAEKQVENAGKFIQRMEDHIKDRLLTQESSK